MKRFVGIILLLAITLTVASQNVADTINYRISGVVRSKASGKPLDNVSIMVAKTKISTVTNSDGYFTLKLNELPSSINISSIGYSTTVILPQNKAEQHFNINLAQAAISLPELYVYQNDAEKLVFGAIKKIKENFVQSNELQTSFYRETIQKGNRYIDVAEAILSTYKRGYSNGVLRDQVKILHGRHIVSQRLKDTISVKILGGPTTPITLDAVKNTDILIDDIEHQCYNFEMEIPEMIDDRPQFVISFKPKTIEAWALYSGKMYIDKQTLAFTRIEFSLDMSDRDKATRAMLYKKPTGLKFRPMELSTCVNYNDGRISYMNTVFRFKCDWKKHLFSRTYRCTSEMVVTDVNSNYSGVGFDSKERFYKSETFNDAVREFSDPDFWKNYNIIEPTISLEKAILKIRKTN